ncbi:hypothetical protein LTR70_010376 [Exophiala xenobiotica]|uniref:Uncharacterized protein n=1 Tax=Lithohypha guttulata TaxID=1690604 RepID=A0ABR0JU88_9EURO|nr:hypothetical protein LTR24_010338 [Lithohypha guttulata]KAK5309343.1 hypothetical protein LTR70_010376 [Exophiala xenobiotica]
MPARRKSKVQNVSRVAGQLGYGKDWRNLSYWIIQFWKPNHVPQSFMELPHDDLTKIAHDFVQQKGSEYWNGTNPLSPVLPQDFEFIKTSVTEILRRQQRNQNDRAARRRNETKSARLCTQHSDDYDDAEFEEDPATGTHQEGATSLPSAARSIGPELRAIWVEQPTMGTHGSSIQTHSSLPVGSDPHDRDGACLSITSANARAVHPQRYCGSRSIRPNGNHRRLQPNYVRHSSGECETRPLSKEVQRGEPVLYDVLDQLYSLERGKAAQFLPEVLDMMQFERARVKMKQRRAVTETDKIVARAEANLLRELCEKIQDVGGSLGSKLVKEYETTN